VRGGDAEYVFAANEYGRYCIPKDVTHRPAAQAILAGGVWEPDTIRFLARQIRAGDIVHAGAFFGDFLPALSRAVGSGGRVWAFEPNPQSYAAAHCTLTMNGLQNVSLHNAGLGEATARRPFRTRDRSGEMLGGASHFVDGGDGEMCSVVRLDDVIPLLRTVSVIHLDIEQYEERALAGAARILDMQRPLLVLETLPSVPFMARLGRLGYSVRGAIDGNKILVANRRG
jgi:FkbM family methyltransferase